MSMTLPVATPLPSTEHPLNQVLEVCGCRSAAVHQLAGIRPLAPGCAVSLQFGDRVDVTGSGGICLTIRCGLKMNGAADHTIGATCWQVRLPAQLAAGSDRLSLALEADLILANDVTIADSLARGREAYRHLLLLIADARDTLAELHLDKSATDDASGPALLIEARLLGDLISGRSGLIAGRSLRISARHRRIMSAACDWLAHQALPDLARAVRAVIRQANPSPLVPARTDAAACKTEPHLWPHDGQSSVANDPSIVPALEPIR